MKVLPLRSVPLWLKTINASSCVSACTGRSGRLPPGLHLLVRHVDVALVAPPTEGVVVMVLSSAARNFDQSFLSVKKKKMQLYQ